MISQSLKIWERTTENKLENNVGAKSSHSLIQFRTLMGSESKPPLDILCNPEKTE